VTRVGEVLPLTERIDRFQRGHPEIKIAAPWSASGKWEVSEPDTPARAYDRGVDMMDDLEARYPPDRQ
jgi:hypothetical protein